MLAAGRDIYFPGCDMNAELDALAPAPCLLAAPMALLCVPALLGLALSVARPAAAWVGDCCVGVSRHFWHLGASPAVCMDAAMRLW